MGINPLGLNWRRFIVCVDKAGELIGCGQIKPHLDGSRELASIAVTPEHQRRGVGSALVAHLLNLASPPIYLICRARLGAYYARFGFRPGETDRMPIYFRMVLRIVGLLKRCFSKIEGILVMEWRG